MPGPEATAVQRSSFHAVYSETMHRANAAERYFFDQGYLERVLAFERSWLFLCHSPEGAAAAGAIAGLSDGIVHYYLGGTADARSRPDRRSRTSSTRWSASPIGSSCR